MAKVRTLSRVFMKGHPKAGQPTYFIDKVMQSLGLNLVQLQEEWGGDVPLPKGHTIRLGRHFKHEDELTLAIWSDKPYRSKQIKLWTGPIRAIDIFIDSRKGGISIYKDLGRTCESINIYDVAKNDGLSFEDFQAWFKLSEGTHSAQILIWNPAITY